MLSYTEFKDRVLNEFLDYLPAKYKDCEVKIHEIPKVNKMLTGVVIVPKKKDKSKKGMIMPTFYLERLYEQYLETGNFENMMQKQAVYLEQSAKYLPEELFETKFEDYQNKVVFQLVNTLENLVLLSKCPHRSFEDLSVVYRAITKCDSCGVSGFLITNDVAQSMNWTEEFLYDKALTNTRMLFPFVHMRIEEMMMKIMGAGRSKESISKLFPEYEHMSAEECVYVGDTVSRDVIGSKRAGFAAAVQIGSKLTKEKDQALDQALAPDVVIEDIYDVARVVREMAEAGPLSPRFIPAR